MICDSECDGWRRGRRLVHATEIVMCDVQTSSTHTANGAGIGIHGLEVLARVRARDGDQRAWRDRCDWRT